MAELQEQIAHFEAQQIKLQHDAIRQESPALSMSAQILGLIIEEMKKVAKRRESQVQP